MKLRLLIFILLTASALIVLTFLRRPVIAQSPTPVTSCGSLSAANTSYVLQNDISSAGTCITISNNNITFDLNGHKITYDTGATASVYGIQLPVGTAGTHLTSSVAGGGVFNSTACKINLQTTPNTSGLCTGAYAIYDQGSNALGTVEIDHLTIVNYGLDSSGIRAFPNNGGSANIHDNTLCPYYTKTALNHFTVIGEIWMSGFSGGPAVVNNNIVGGTACLSVTGFSQGYGYVGIYIEHPQPFSPTLKITNNQISMAAPVRDGYGIEILCNANSTTVLNFEIANNTVIRSGGRGILMDAEGAQDSMGCGTGTIHDNTINVKEPANEGAGSGDALGVTVRFNASHIQVYNNNITVAVGAGQCPAQFFTDTASDCSGIGIKLQGNVGTSGLDLQNTATNNTVTVTTNGTAFTPVGLYGNSTGGPLSYFSGNTVTSNAVNVASVPNGAGNGFDGCGNHWTYKNNTFIEGPNPFSYLTYATLWFCNSSTQQPGGSDATGNVFLDNIYSGGAGVDNVGLSTGNNSFSYFAEWTYTLTVKGSNGLPISGATVTAVGANNTETIAGTTSTNGQVPLILTDHFTSGTSLSSATTTQYNAHSVTISAPGCPSLNYSLTITAPTSDTRTLSCGGSGPGPSVAPAPTIFAARGIAK